MLICFRMMMIQTKRLRLEVTHLVVWMERRWTLHTLNSLKCLGKARLER